MTITNMANLSSGDIVLLKFPFTDGKSFKKRPALVLYVDSDDGDVVVCRITSKLHTTSFDFLLKNWKKQGLKLPSVVRIHKIASLERELIDMKIGQLDKIALNQVKRMFKKLVA